MGVEKMDGNHRIKTITKEEYILIISLIVVIFLLIPISYVLYDNNWFKELTVNIGKFNPKLLIVALPLSFLLLCIVFTFSLKNEIYYDKKELLVKIGLKKYKYKTDKINNICININDSHTNYYNKRSNIKCIYLLIEYEYKKQKILIKKINCKKIIRYSHLINEVSKLNLYIQNKCKN